MLPPGYCAESLCAEAVQQTTFIRKIYCLLLANYPNYFLANKVTDNKPTPIFTANLSQPVYCGFKAQE